MSSYAKTRADANKKLRELVQRAERNAPIAPAGMTVSGYLDEWLVHVKQHVRPSTWTAYEGNTRLHIVPRIGRKKLSRLGVRDVRLMVDGMRADGVGQRTIQYVHATLRAALEHAFREELVSRNVATLVRVERPRPAKKEPLSVEEARELLAATAADRHHALWVLMVMLGLRRSEVCGLRWDHVDFGAGTLSIEQTVQRVEGKLRELPTKTRRSTRTVPLPGRALYALTEHHRQAQARGGRPGRPVHPQGYVVGTSRGTALEPRWSRAGAAQPYPHVHRAGRPEGATARIAPHLHQPAPGPWRPPEDRDGNRRTQRDGDDHEHLRTHPGQPT